MAGRRTNLALFALLAAALATGGLAYAVGTGWNRWAVVAHATAGFAIVALAPWKSGIARRGLDRRGPAAWASLVFSIAVAVSIGFGIVHAAGALRPAGGGGVTAMQVHVGTALAAIPFAVWHVVARRVRPRRTDLSRRAFLRAGVLAGGAGAAYAATEGLWRLASLPGADRRFTGSHEAGSLRPDIMPVVQWLNDGVPAIDPSAWRLAVRSGRERAWTYEELARFDDRVRATLDCTGGWFAVQDWEGARLDRLLLPGPRGRSILVRSETGYTRRFPLADAPRLLLATRAGGAPLSAGHGFPARLVAPGRRGYWWVKWVTAIEVSDAPWWWQPPYPLT